MKKIVALILAVAMIFTLSVTAFAAVSPQSGKDYAVVFLFDDGTKPFKKVYEYTGEGKLAEQEVITIVAHDPRIGGTFDGWDIFKKDGAKAVVDTDYILVSEDYQQITLKFIPGTDLIVVAKYDGRTPDLSEVVEMFESISPITGDTVVLGLSVLATIALAGVCLTKKAAAK